MKFTLVLILSLCAFAAQTSATQYDEVAEFNELAVQDELELPIDYELELYGNFGLLEKLRELIQKIIEKAIEATEKITQEIEKVITIALEKIQNVVDRANQLIKRVIQAILDKIKEAAAAGQVAKRCADNATVELQEVAKKAQEDLQGCANTAIDQIKGIRQDIDEQIETIKQNIEILGDIVVTCLEQNGNPISAIRCITNQANDIREKIVSILKNAKDGVVIATKRSLEITNQANQCVQKTVVQLQQQALSIAKKFRDCIKENQPQTYLLN